MITLGIWLLGICVHAQREWEMLTPLQGSLRNIVLADARLFNISAEEANRKVEQAFKQYELLRNEVQAWNRPQVFEQWKQECYLRIACWSHLGKAAMQQAGECHFVVQNYDGTISLLKGYQTTREPYWRLQSLHHLYDLLGHDDFYAGRMPSPTPNYNINPNR